MATAAQHRAEIDRINIEVAAQAAKIATISDILTEKGSTSNAVGETAATPMTKNTASLNALIEKAQALPNEAVLQEKTATPSTSAQDVIPDDGYDGMSKVTVNAMPSATQAVPNITVNANGLITASATQAAGYVASGTKTATKQLTVETWTFELESGSTTEKVVVL